MKLHRAINADWSNVESAKLNSWQKVAINTNGVITAGNFVSLVGGLLVVYGLVLLYQKNIWPAVGFLVGGRLADLLDGLIADWTQTKSPIGEGFDATIDKIEIVLTIFVLWLASLVPSFVLIIMTLHTIYNVGLYLVSYFKERPIHPSYSGKLAVASQWIVISIFTVINSYKIDSPWHGIMYCIAIIVFVVFVVLGAFSSIGYTKQLGETNGD